jgi:hypothetical protein
MFWLYIYNHHQAEHRTIIKKSINLMFIDPCIVILKLVERTNKMQPCSRMYYSNVS